ncbi:MAG: L,D-transpeptidase [Xenococcaceae cyanobacterium MO_188.B19]|nr:L,D-transpeptidase [Xenococcaceae cyanobacterium MO_188.B19]
MFSQVKVKNNLKLVSTSSELLNYQLPITEIIIAPIDKSQTAILIEKSQYRLTIYYQNQAIKSYPVVFGQNPVGDKLQERDMKTPEGIFKVRDLYPHNSWSKFIWLDYPNDDSWSKHLEAKKSGKIKVSAAIGGEIGIHGVPDNSDLLIDNRDNWTWGCISLKNKDVDEIYSVIQTGTIVKIIP